MTFAPSTAGTRTATLEIGSIDANKNPLMINLSGLQATPLETWRVANVGPPDNTGLGADAVDVAGRIGKGSVCIS